MFNFLHLQLENENTLSISYLIEGDNRISILSLHDTCMFSSFVFYSFYKLNPQFIWGLGVHRSHVKRVLMSASKELCAIQLREKKSERKREGPHYQNKLKGSRRYVHCFSSHSLYSCHHGLEDWHFPHCIPHFIRHFLTEFKTVSSICI